MLEIWRIYRARRAAVRGIRPFVDRSRARLGGISDQVWLDSYLIGFIGMLVTLIARTESARLGTQSLGLVQAEAWGAITDASADLIGSEMCLLSAAGSADFMAGCENGKRFFNALCGRPLSALPDDPDLDLPAGGSRVSFEGEQRVSGYSNPDILWPIYFDAHVEALQTRAPLLPDA